MTIFSLVMALLLQSFAHSKVTTDDTLRDVRELFDSDSIEDIDNNIEEDVIQSLPTFVKNVFKIAKSSPPPPSDSVELKSILESSLGDQYPEFGIDVGINDLSTNLDDSKGFDIVFNISKRTNDVNASNDFKSKQNKNIIELKTQSPRKLESNFKVSPWKPIQKEYKKTNPRKVYYHHHPHPYSLLAHPISVACKGLRNLFYRNYFPPSFIHPHSTRVSKFYFR